MSRATLKSQPKGHSFPEDLPLAVIVARLLAVGGLVGTLFFFALGAYGFHENQLFLADSGQTVGKLENNDGAMGGSFHHVRYVSYSYQVKGAVYISPEIYVTASTWDEIQASNHIPIRYLRQSPSESRIDLPAEARLDALRPGAAIGLGLMLLLVVIVCIRQDCKRWRKPGDKQHE